MTGIYDDSFVSFLKRNLGDPVKIASKNIICRCPWCEFGLEKKHYHCYISLDSPIFNCFYADCGQHGTVAKLIKKIRGTYPRDNEFFDSSKYSFSHKSSSAIRFEDKISKSLVYNRDSSVLSKYDYKLRYVTSRLCFPDPLSSTLHSLVLDVHDFLLRNKIKMEKKVLDLLPWLDQNFVGFVSEHERVLILRNVNQFSTFRYLKIPLVQDDFPFVDYYLIRNAKFSTSSDGLPVVVIGEGVFDIASEFYNNTIHKREVADLYACSLGLQGFQSLLKSLAFFEDIYKCHLVILADQGIPLNYYRKLKKKYSFMLSSVEVYFNKTGKDFACMPCFPEKFVL